MHDLQQAVLAAKAKYDGRSKDNKAKRWLSRFSKRVMLYSNILDTFVQHHPEYTALAWGTFKLLFVVSSREFYGKLCQDSKFDEADDVGLAGSERRRVSFRIIESYVQDRRGASENRTEGSNL